MRLTLAVGSLFVAACSESEPATTSGGSGGAASSASVGGAGSGADGGTSAASGGGGGVSGGGGGPCGAGTPLDVPADTWTYVAVPGSECADGSETGFAVNPTGNKRLLFFLKGGGACFSESDCGASHLNGITEAEVLAEVESIGLFDRGSATNPYADYSFVYVPYCTGDFHAGSKISAGGRHHMGYANIEKYLASVVPTFCDSEHVVLLGTSAGGFGTASNYVRLHESFGDIPVDMVDDSGPYMRPPHMPSDMQAAIDENWGFRGNMPADCAECQTTWHSLYAHAAAKYPDDRMALVSSLQDPSIQGRFAPYGSMKTLADFQIAIDDLADAVVVPLPNMKVFYVPQQGHVWTTGNIGGLVVDGTSLEQFLRQQIDDDPAWANVRP